MYHPVVFDPLAFAGLAPHGLCQEKATFFKEMRFLNGRTDLVKGRQ